MGEERERESNENRISQELIVIRAWIMEEASSGQIGHSLDPPHKNTIKGRDVMEWNATIVVLWFGYMYTQLFQVVWVCGRESGDARLGREENKSEIKIVSGSFYSSMRVS